MSVNPSTGAYSIEAKYVTVKTRKSNLFRFSWPKEMDGDGCPALLSPTVTIRRSSGGSPNTLALQVLKDNLLIELNLDNGAIINSVLAQDYFFTGYENMAYDLSASNTLKGRITFNLLYCKR